MYLRGRGYCFRAMDERFKGVSKDLVKDAATMERAVKRFTDKKDVELLYWMAASWGAAISLGRDQPEIFIDFPAVRALAAQAMALDPSWNNGALYEIMITIDSLPEMMGGSPDRAKEDFKRAIEIQKGASPGPYVSLALNIAQPAQDREEFIKLLNQAIAIDPEKDPSNRLVTILMQRKAKALLEHIDELFAGKAFYLSSRHTAMEAHSCLF
jgi:tetratricopeptide (TPR) repeat protein